MVIQNVFWSRKTEHRHTDSRQFADWLGGIHLQYVSFSDSRCRGFGYAPSGDADQLSFSLLYDGRSGHHYFQNLCPSLRCATVRPDGPKRQSFYGVQFLLVPAPRRLGISDSKTNCCIFSTGTRSGLSDSVNLSTDDPHVDFQHHQRSFPRSCKNPYPRTHQYHGKTASVSNSVSTDSLLPESVFLPYDYFGLSLLCHR